MTTAPVEAAAGAAEAAADAIKTVKASTAAALIGAAALAAWFIMRRFGSELAAALDPADPLGLDPVPVFDLGPVDEEYDDSDGGDVGV